MKDFYKIGALFLLALGLGIFLFLTLYSYEEKIADNEMVITDKDVTKYKDVQVSKDSKYDYQLEYENQEHVREHFDSADEFGTKVDDSTSTFVDNTGNSSDEGVHLEDHTVLSVDEQYAETQDNSKDTFSMGDGNGYGDNNNETDNTFAEEQEELRWVVYNDGNCYMVRKGTYQETLILLWEDTTNLPQDCFQWDNNVYYMVDESSYYLYIVRENVISCYSLSNQTPYFEEVMQALKGILF